MLSVFRCSNQVFCRKGFDVEKILRKDLFYADTKVRSNSLLFQESTGLVKRVEGLMLRRAEEKDCRFLFDLRNEEEVRKNSFQTQPIPYEQHETWFRRKLSEKQTKIFILELEQQPAGQVRIDICGEKAEISYALCRGARGHGYSKWMLSELELRARKDGWCSGLIAEVKRENIASRKIFQSLEYRETVTEYGYLYEKDWGVGSQS